MSLSQTPAKMADSIASGSRMERTSKQDLQRLAKNVLAGIDYKTPSSSKPFQTPIASSIKSEAKGSHASSVKARRERLILDHAKRKAQLEMTLNDQQLRVDLAELEDEERNYSPQEDRTREVEQWLERSRLETPPPDHSIPTGERPAMASATQPTLTLRQALPPETTHLPMEIQPPTPLTSTGIVEAVQMLAKELKDLASTSAPNTNSNNLLTRLCTPKDLPEFSGDPLEWLQFKQAYSESTDVCNFSPKENLWRLRKCLRGAAKDAVAALFITATTPCKVMSTLELRFGDPQYVISRIMHDIKKLQPMSQEYHKDIVQFSVKVQNLMESVRAVGHDEYLQGMSIVSLLLSKFPPILLYKWSDYSYPIITADKRKPRIEILADFLNNEAIKITATANLHFLNPRTDINKYKNNESSNRTHTLLLQSDNEEKCLFCRIGVHKLTDCKPFKKALRKTRWLHVKNKGICYQCLLSRHRRDLCSAPACDVNGCGGAHHRLLHFESKSPPATGDTFDASCKQ